MYSMNVVALVGRLTGDPNMAATQSGTMVAKWITAVNRDKDDTDFISCVAFGKTAEFIEQYFHKGMLIAVQGKIRTGNYTDKDGRKIYTTDVVADRVDFMEKKGAPSTPADDLIENNKDIFMVIPDNAMDELPFN